jgi:hypothetical protein
MTGRIVLCAVAILLAGCTQTVPGTALRSAPLLDEDSRSPVDVDAVLLDRAQMQAVTGSGPDLTPVPGMESKVPVDVPGGASSECGWVLAESEVFGPAVEEFHKTTYQNPARGGLISQAAAGYLDTATAARAFADLTVRISRCADSPEGPALVGEVSEEGSAVRTRPGSCGRDYRVKSAVLVEVTFCGFPESVPDLVMTNIVRNVPG